MLKLRLVDARPTCARHDPGAAGVETWRDADGAVCAYGGRNGSAYWLVVPVVGEFRIHPDTDEVIGIADRMASPDVVADAFRRIVLPLALQAGGREVLHASAALGSAGVIGICGVSGSGKSSMAAALETLGLRLFADDALAIEVTSTGAEALPLPFRLSLLEPAAGFLGRRAGLHDIGPPPGRAPLRALCVLEHVPLVPARLDRLSSSEAFTSVLPHAYCFTLADRNRTHAMIDAYLGLVTEVPVLRLRFPHDLAGLPGIAEQLCRTVAALER